MAPPATKAAAAAKSARPADLLAWYDANARALPWRQRSGARAKADPYRVWLSEIMLQQTTVAAVIPYFEAFTARWPSVTALAEAEEAEVMAAWAGLGYYARARNLIACARAVAFERGGVFPDTEDGLRALPGIGVYTGAAIAAIAFGRPAVVVDGNVERVMARLFAVREELPGAKPALRDLAASLTPKTRPGDYAQAVMDLGATICTPKNPSCGACPWSGACAGRAQGIAADLPAKAPKKEKPTRRGAVFWLERPDGSVLVRTRPKKGLLGGMSEFPSTQWRDAPLPGGNALSAGSPLPAALEPVPGMVKHTFTHFHLELSVYRGALEARIAPPAEQQARFVAPGDLGSEALPTVMRKVADLVLGGAGPLFR